MLFDTVKVSIDGMLENLFTNWGDGMCPMVRALLMYDPFQK